MGAPKAQPAVETSPTPTLTPPVADPVETMTTPVAPTPGVVPIPPVEEPCPEPTPVIPVIPTVVQPEPDPKDLAQQAAMDKNPDDAWRRSPRKSGGEPSIWAKSESSAGKPRTTLSTARFGTDGFGSKPTFGAASTDGLGSAAASKPKILLSIEAAMMAPSETDNIFADFHGSACDSRNQDSSPRPLKAGFLELHEEGVSGSPRSNGRRNTRSSSPRPGRTHSISPSLSCRDMNENRSRARSASPHEVGRRLSRSEGENQISDVAFTRAASAPKRTSPRSHDHDETNNNHGGHGGAAERGSKDQAVPDTLEVIPEKEKLRVKLHKKEGSRDKSSEGERSEGDPPLKTKRDRTHKKEGSSDKTRSSDRNSDGRNKHHKKENSRDKGATTDRSDRSGPKTDRGGSERPRSPVVIDGVIGTTKSSVSQGESQPSSPKPGGSLQGSADLAPQSPDQPQQPVDDKAPQSPDQPQDDEAPQSPDQPQQPVGDAAATEDPQVPPVSIEIEDATEPKSEPPQEHKKAEERPEGEEGEVPQAAEEATEAVVVAGSEAAVVEDEAKKQESEDTASNVDQGKSCQEDVQPKVEEKVEKKVDDPKTTENKPTIELEFNSEESS